MNIGSGPQSQTTNADGGANQNQLREVTAGKLRTVGLLYVTLAILLVIVGAVGMHFGAPDMPYVIPLHIITGLILMIAGICACVASRRTRTESETSTCTKVLVISLFTTSIMGVVFCILTTVINGAIGVAFCLGVEYTERTYSSGVTKREVNDQCTVNKNENIALCSITIVLGLVGGLFCILGIIYFCTGFIKLFTQNVNRTGDQMAGCCIVRLGMMGGTRGSAIPASTNQVYPTTSSLVLGANGAGLDFLKQT